MLPIWARVLTNLLALQIKTTVIKEIIMITKDTILFVDDDASILKSIQRTQRSESYRILTASSATEAAMCLVLHPVRIIACDYQMAGMNGLEYLSKVAPQLPDTWRILLSGNVDEALAAEAVERGVVHFVLWKPLKSDALTERIQTCLGTRPQRIKTLHPAAVQ
jgi:DNA-binding NtrC family response regulator